MSQTPESSQSQSQKPELPEYVKELFKGKAELRNDVLDVAIAIVFKVAELDNTFLNAQFILNSIIGAKVHTDGIRVIAELYLINGMIIKAIVTKKDSFIVIDSMMQCYC